MKKLLIICLAIAMVGCKKDNGGISATTNNIDVSLLYGTWKHEKNMTTYTDLNGKQQVVDYGVKYTYIINSNGMANKTTLDFMGRTLQTYITAVPYKIINKDNKTYIAFLVSPDDISDTYEIITLTNNSLVLHINQGNFTEYKNGKSNVIGSNTILDEEYYK